MATGNPKNQVGQGRDWARTTLDFNNSATSATRDRLFSLLDGADGSVYVRQLLDTVIHDMSNGTTEEFNWREYRRWTSIKDKIAYFVGSRYAHSVNAGLSASVHAHTETVQADEGLLRSDLDAVINELQSRLIDNQDFDESRIIRHASLNRFETKLNTKEKTDLTKLSISLKKVAETEGFDVLAEAMHFTQESDAQKLMKISEAVAMMTNAGVSIDAKILEQADVMLEKIKPLKDLDRQYKHLTNVLNMIHRIGKEYPSMISAGQQKKLVAVLKDLGIEQQTQILDSSKTLDSEDGYLEKQLYALKHKDPAKLEEALKKNNVNEREFHGRYVSYFGYKSVEKAKKDLDNSKAAAFGHKKPDFEKDVNSWRGIARNRILQTHARMTGDPLQFGPGDYDFVNSYFDKFKDIFYAHENDADEATGGHYQQMLDITSAIVRARVPALTIGNRRRFGSALRGVMQRIQNPQLRSFMNRWHQADDAQLMAMVIISQNEATNMMFYDDKDPFAKDESRMDKLAKLVGRAELGRNAVKQKISKPLNTVLRLGEGALRIGAKVTNKVVSNTGRALTWAPAGILGALNRAMERRTVENGKDKMHIKWYAAPVWAVTRLMEESFVAVNKGFNYTNKHGNEIMHDARAKSIEMLQDGFSDKNITNIFQGFTHALDGATKFLAEGVASGGNAVYDIRDANQKRSVLSAFFEAAEQEGDLQELMSSCDIAQMLNLKVRGPYIFDEDGRAMTLDKTEKYPDNDAGRDALTGDTFTKWHDDLQKQFKAHFDGIKDKFDAADAQLDDLMPSDKNYDEVKNRLSAVGVTLDTLTDKQTQINQLMLLLANMGSSATKDFDALADDIKTVVDAMKKSYNDGEKQIDNTVKTNPGYKQQLEKKDKEIADAKQKLEAIDRKLGSTVKKGDEATSDLKDKRKTKQKEVSAEEVKVGKYEQEVLDYEGKIRVYEDENKDYKEEIVQLQRKKTNAERTKDSLFKSEKEIGKMEKEIDNLNKDLQLVSDLPGQIAQIKRDLVAEGGKLSSASKGKIDTLNSEKTTLTNQLNVAKKKGLAGTADVLRLTKEIEAINTQIVDLKKGGDPVKLAEMEKDLATLETQLRDLRDKNYYRQEINRINKKKDQLELDKYYDDRHTFEGKAPSAFIKQIDAEITKIKAKMLANTTALKKTEKDRSDARKKVSDAQLKVKELTNELRDIDNSLSSKSPDDKSRVAYQAEKGTLESNIAKWTQEKTILESKIKKQEERNKVHRTIRKRGNKVQSAATQLQAIQVGALTPEAKRKEIMKLMKTIDLSFAKAPENKTTFDFNSLTEAQKAQIAAILNPTV